MKKVALSLLAFGLVGALAVAQDAPVAKVSGYVNSGVKVTKANGNDWSALEYADDYGAAGTYGKITASVSTDTYGVTVAVLPNTGGTSVLDTAKGWAKIADPFSVFAGTGYNDSFDGVDDTSNDYFWGGNKSAVGGIFTLNGFSAGATYGTSGTTGSKLTPVGFGASYTADVFALHATGLTTGDAQKVDKFGVTAKFSGVDKLVVTGGFYEEALSGSSNGWGDATITYTVSDPLSVGITGYDYLNASYYKINPYLTYKLTSEFAVTPSYTYYTDGKTAADGTTGAENEIKLKGVYTLAGGASLVAWYDYMVAAKNNEIYLEYIASF